MSPPTRRAVIDFFADLVCPWCYLGWAALKQGAGAVAEDIRCTLTWRTFLLHPDMPASGVDRRAYLTARFGAASPELTAARNALVSSAEALGVPLDLDAASRLPNTADAHRLIHWACEDGVAETVIDAMFHAYFVAGDDIGDRDVLSAIAQTAGLEARAARARLDAEADRDVIAQRHAAAQSLGVTGVPITLVNRTAMLMGAQTAEVYSEALRRAAA